MARQFSNDITQVVSAPLGISRNREIAWAANDPAATRKRIDWGVANIKAVSIRFVFTGTVPTETKQLFYALFDVASETTATALLATPSPDDGTADMQRVSIVPEVSTSSLTREGETFVASFSSPIRYLDMTNAVAIGASSGWRAYVEAVS